MHKQERATIKAEVKICTGSDGSKYLVIPLSSQQVSTLFGKKSSSVTSHSSTNLFGKRCSVRFFSSESNNGGDGNDGKTPEDKSSLVTVGDAETAYKNNNSIAFPEKVLVVPLSKRPFFPGILVPVQLNDWDLIEALTKWKQRSPYVGLFLQKETGEKKVNSAGDIHKVGILGTISGITGFKNQTAQVVFSGFYRIEISGFEPNHNGKFLVAQIKKLEDSPYDKEDREIKAYHSEIIATIRDIMKLAGSMYKEQLYQLFQNANVSEPGEIADLAAAFTSADADKLQDVLETLDIKERQRKAVNLLKAELDQLKFQQKLNKQIEDSLNQTQRRFFLQEQLKAIKKELGLEKDEKGSLTEEFQNRIKNLTIPEGPLKVINDELNKLSTLEPSSSEYNVSRNYLDWLTSLPWGVYSKEVFDIKGGQKVLDEDHYGLKDVKERILEFIAVGKLKTTVQGKILCFAGPPGVGKTSIGKSIARALNRQFYRFSVGGMWDTAEIKGHRRTYIGAMPGKMIQCLKTVKAANPVILIDEIDKMGGVSHHGDPASALLEVLDPEQNKAFLDHYLDVPFDLSKVLFICTANVTHTIPGPLLDRMEIINLSGYVTEEKLAIAKKYLIPKARTDAGLHAKDVQIKDDALRLLITQYCREAGVRNLQRQIEKVFRKTAFKVVKGTRSQIIVDHDNLHQFVGKPVFSTEKYYEVTPTGVVTGLAWTAMGGATLYIETVADKLTNKAALKVTGQLGDVMKESTDIAYTYAKTFLSEADTSNKFFETAAVHMHVPEGATPKDGPSAGITMVTALLSLALNRPIKPNVAMTGEITLTGKVLPIGGVKEKTIAARRAGIKEMIIPKGNQKDWDELAEYITKGIKVHFADTYVEVFQVVFEAEKKKVSPVTTLRTLTLPATPKGIIVPTKKTSLKKKKSKTFKEIHQAKEKK